ncbi:MAG: hypothetical protein ABI919_00675 [Ramlibacter sp.]
MNKRWVALFSAVVGTMASGADSNQPAPLAGAPHILAAALFDMPALDPWAALLTTYALLVLGGLVVAVLACLMLLDFCKLIRVLPRSNEDMVFY